MIMRQKTFLFSTLLLSSIIGVGSAAASDLLQGAYVAVGGGLALPQGKINMLDASEPYYNAVKIKNRGVFRFAIGKDFDFLRGELEYLRFGKKSIITQGNNDVIPYSYSAKAAVKSEAYFANLYYDIKNFNESVVPYIGAGIGVARHRVSQLMHNSIYTGLFVVNHTDWFAPKSTNAFAWNVGVGAKINLNSAFALDISYKFADLGKIKGGMHYIDSDNDTGTVNKDTIKGRVRHHLILASIVYKM